MQAFGTTEKERSDLLIRESLELSLDSLEHRKISSALTILGIVIGISAIIGLVSIGQGLEDAVSKQLESFGSDKIIIMPQASGGMLATAFFGEGLKEDDVKKIENVNGVKVAVGFFFKTLPVKYKNEIRTTYIIGMHSDEAEKIFSEMQSFEIDEGRYFKKGEEDLALLGSLASKDLFGKEVRIGDSIFIKDKKFKVVGTIKSLGNNQDDNQIYISLESLRELTGDKDSLTSVIVKVTDVSRIENIAQNIEKKLDNLYGEDTFSAITSQQIIDRVGSIFSILSFVLGGIASIALVVAGVGIANTMFTSVIERTKEIGIMKAIGATNYNVMEIFLVESALLGFLGGVIGCVVGVVLSKIITIAAGGMLPVSFEATVTPEMIILSLLFSVVVGIVSGLFPARRAAKLQPIEALRYE